MSGSGSIGFGFATAFLSALGAGWFATIQSGRLGETPEEQAWRAFFYAVAGFGAGMILGIPIALLSRAGFLRTFAIVACLVVAVAGAGAIWDRRFGWVPNRINGEKVVLLLEIKMPQGWNPELLRDPRGSGCTLSPNGDRVPGKFEWNRRELRDGERWVVPCWFELRSLYRRRLLGLNLANDANPSAKDRSSEWLDITLPSEPYTEKDAHWTKWSDEGSNPNYESRLRIVPEGPFMAEQEAARAARRAQQWSRWAALDAKAPLELWVEPFGPAADAREGDAPRGAAERLQELVNQRPAEFAAMLAPPDRERVRAAVYALSNVTIPAPVTPALIEAGTQVASFAASARDTKAGDLQDQAEDAAWDFFEHWTQAIERASPPRDNARYGVLMDEVQKASGRRHSVMPTDLPSRLVRRIDTIKAGL